MIKVSAKRAIFPNNPFRVCKRRRAAVLKVYKFSQIRELDELTNLIFVEMILAGNLISIVVSILLFCFNCNWEQNNQITCHLG